MAKLYEPMLLTATEALPDGEDWVFEPKLDGYRAVSYVTDERTRIRSRQGNNLNDYFPDVVAQLPAALSGHAAVIDGEVVGFDQEGHHSLRTVRSRTSRITYYIFDLLELDGEPLIFKKWQERRGLLERNTDQQANIEVCPNFTYGDRDVLLVATRGLALEGIVAKRSGSIYRPGRRSRDWQKLKFNKYGRT